MYKKPTGVRASKESSFANLCNYAIFKSSTTEFVKYAGNKKQGEKQTSKQAEHLRANTSLMV